MTLQRDMFRAGSGYKPIAAKRYGGVGLVVRSYTTEHEEYNEEVTASVSWVI
jgi:hypothetical protein